MLRLELRAGQLECALAALPELSRVRDERRQADPVRLVDVVLDLPLDLVLGDSARPVGLALDCPRNSGVVGAGLYLGAHSGSRIGGCQTMGGRPARTMRKSVLGLSLRPCPHGCRIPSTYPRSAGGMPPGARKRSGSVRMAKLATYTTASGNGR